MIRRPPRSTLLAYTTLFRSHIGGHGTPAKLAAAVHAGLALTGTPLGAAPAAPPAASLGIDTAQIGQILGFHGRVNGGVYQVGVPRAEAITADGVEVPPSMGLATAINFQPTGGGKAAITGDFVLIGDEVRSEERRVGKECRSRWSPYH